MKMMDWDTAVFTGFRHVVEYFHLENQFIQFFNKPYNRVELSGKDPYQESQLINEILGWLDEGPQVLWFSHYNDIEKLFEVNKMTIAPKNIEDAHSMKQYLEDYLNQAEKAK